MSSFSAEVWKTLSAINVNEHTEKKGNLTYLSWAWAWGTLMDHYPASKFEIMDDVRGDDGTVTVWCSVTMQSDPTKMLTREMWLPVMDHRNAAIKNPDARQVSDARMRCLTKCLALFGLGHYIYAGEDTPTAEADQAKEESNKALEKWTATLDTCTTVDALRDKLTEARAVFHGDPKGWKELRRIGVIKKEELEKANVN